MDTIQQITIVVLVIVFGTIGIIISMSYAKQLSEQQIMPDAVKCLAHYIGEFRNNLTIHNLELIYKSCVEQ
jgi:hypothetical protein